MKNKIMGIMYFDGEEDQETMFDYYLGETITLNSTGQAKCVKIIERENGYKEYYFKFGRMEFVYDDEE